MNIVPMDTMNGGPEPLIGRDITIRITIEILESGPCHTGSITRLGVEVQTALMLMIPDMNLGLGSSSHCPARYTGTSTGMIFPGRYEAEGPSGITSTAAAAPHTRPSLETSLLRGWPAKGPGPPGPPVAAAPGAGPPAATPSVAAAAPAATVVIPAAVQAMTPQPDQFNLPPSPHPPLSCFHLWRKRSPGKVLGSRFRIFQCALQIQALKMAFFTNLRNLVR